MVTDQLKKFQNEFLAKIETKNSWGKNEIKTLFNEHCLTLLLHIADDLITQSQNKLAKDQN